MEKVCVLFLLCSTVGFAQKTKEFKVMTYNIYNTFEGGTTKKEGVKWIKEQKNDVIAFQELLNVSEKYLQDLGEDLGFKHSALLKTSGYSVGIVSKRKLEIITKKKKELHHGYMHVKTNGIHFFLVHLSPFKWQVRKKEATLICKEITSLLENKKRVIVLGDFNANIISDASWTNIDLKLLMNHKKMDRNYGYVQNLHDGKIDYETMNVFLNAGLYDSSEKWVTATQVDRVTNPTAIYKSVIAPVIKGGSRIDFILNSYNLHKAVIASEIPHEEVLDVISDHYPVITTYDLRKIK